MDSNAVHYDLFTRVEIQFPSEETAILDKEPFKIFPKKTVLLKDTVKAWFTFRGHYGEPDLYLDIPLDSISLAKETVFAIDYNPNTGVWVSDCC